MSDPTFTTTTHVVARAAVATGIAFDRFRSDFEEAAPAIDLAAVSDIAASGGTWDDVAAATVDTAPHGLMRYATLDAGPVMHLAGHATQVVAYLVGNHVIAETMFRHDATAMLYAPLRFLLHSDADGNAVVSIDQPSALFGSLGIDEVGAVGRGLDGKVIALLAATGVADADRLFSAT